MVDRLIKRSVAWNTTDYVPQVYVDMQSPTSSKWMTVLYEMAIDRAGSYYLESVVECCDEDLYVSLITHGLLGYLNECVINNTGNFVVQAALRRVNSLLVNSLVDESSLQGITAQATRDIISLAERMMSKLSDDEVFNEIKSRKGGVLLWMLEVACSLTEVMRFIESEKTIENEQSQLLSEKTINWADKIAFQTIQSQPKRSDDHSLIEEMEMKALINDFLTQSLRRIQNKGINSTDLLFYSLYVKICKETK